MATIDIVLLIIIGVFGVVGMRRGFLSQVVLIAALLLGIWLTIRFSGFINHTLISNFDISAQDMPLWSFGLTFAAVVIGVCFLVHLFKGAMHVIHLQWLDKILGLAFGMLKGALLISVVLALLSQGGVMQKFISKDAMQKSVLYSPVRGLAPRLFPYLKDFGAAAWSQLMRQQDGE